MKTYALLGDPVARSLSPLFQNAALRAAGIDAEYAAIHVPSAELAAAVDRVRRGELAGANVTIPHKREALRLADTATADARRIGAANWLGTDGEGRLVADNTDAPGFACALAEAQVPVRGAAVVVLGGGGGARAAAFALAAEGARRVVVGARRPEEAEEIERDLGVPVEGMTLEQARAEAASATVVVSAVPPDAWESVAPVRVPAGAWLCDLAYAREGTPLERWARSRGLRVLGGLPMLLHQGALSFERWLGLPFPMAVARAALESAPGGDVGG